MSSDRPILEIHRLDYAYAERLVLKHIDLALAPLSTLGIVGPNGGGKTTLLQLLVGQFQPTRGEILIDGLTPLQAIRRGDVIGYLPQRPQLNVDVPLSCHQVLQLCSIASDCRRCHHLLEAVGLDDLVNEPIRSLSGGQLQRLLIAQALINAPRLLILDEPTTGIDVASRTQFIRLIEQLRQELKLTIVIASHDLHTLKVLCDDVACLNVTLHLHHRRRGDDIPLDETTCSFPTNP